jgi:amino acid adenylation domain-containing protein
MDAFSPPREVADLATDPPIEAIHDNLRDYVFDESDSPRAANLRDLFDRVASREPNRVAVEDERNRAATYGELARFADRIATRLSRWGVDRGDRVGLFLPKCIEGVAAIHGILRAGAAYVPVDPTAPPARGAGILADAAVKAVVVAADRLSELRRAWPSPGPEPRFIVVGANANADDEPIPPDAAAWDDVIADLAPSPLPAPIAPADLAYILYTSGSTGVPKGVMLSHENALTFIDWCVRALDPPAGGRFSSHAPFHFDLSIFDLFVSCARSGTVLLIGETLSKDPTALARFIVDRSVDVWYSAPSILALIAERGDRESLAAAAPGLVLFAGEVFPIKPLRVLRSIWPESTLWNLYGPTETNVCTAFPIPRIIAPTRTDPYPIGRVCAPLSARVIDDEGRDVPPGVQGELVISGPGVMRGYFGRPDLDSRVFFRDQDGVRWYRTGDLVVDDGSTCFTFHGRRDRMIKKRGYRIELGEIESAIYRLDDVERVAVVARSGDSGTTITAFLTMKPDAKKSLIAVKRRCSELLPAYMIPDSIVFLGDLPKTSTDKVDYQRLGALASATI